MAFFSLNPEQMKKYVNSVNEYASFLETERNNIRKKSEGNGDPVPTMLRAVEKDVRIAAPLAPPSQVLGQPQSSFSPALGLTPNTNQLVGLVSILSTAASELQVRYNEVVYLNSQGVSSYNADGTLSYYLPDPPEGQDPSVYWATMDTAANVTQYNSKSVDNGKNSAEKLKKALDSGDQAAANKELAEINKHRDIPAYSSMFCQTMGVAEMLDAPIEAITGPFARLANSIVDTFGHMMAAASTLYDESSTQTKASSPGTKTPWNLRSQIYQAVVDNPGRATVLDALMTADGTVYDTEFLVDLAKDMENIKSWPDVDGSGTTGEGNSIRRSNSYFAGHTADPLAAVLHGMGNNPKAALAYLAPAESDNSMTPFDENADDRWNPSPEAQKRMEMLRSRHWSGLAYHGLTAAFAAASAERIPAINDDTDDRAAWAIGKGIVLLADKGFGEGESYRNVGVMLGNCGPEVLGVANNTGLVPRNNIYNPYASLLSSGESAEKLQNSIAELIYKTSQNPEARAAIAKGTTAYTAASVSAEAEAKGINLEEIKRYYRSEASVINLMSKISGSQDAEASRGAAAAVNAISLIPGMSVPAGIMNVGLSLAGGPEVTSDVHVEQMGLQAPAYLNALSAGLVEPPENASWYSVDSNGKAHIQLDSKEQVQDFNRWVSANPIETPGVDKDGKPVKVAVNFGEVGTKWDREGKENDEIVAAEFKKTYKANNW